MCVWRRTGSFCRKAPGAYGDFGASAARVFSHASCHEREELLADARPGLPVHYSRHCCFLRVLLFVRWHYAEITGEYGVYESALARLPRALRDSWALRAHCRGCLFLFCCVLFAVFLARSIGSHLSVVSVSLWTFDRGGLVRQCRRLGALFCRCCFVSLVFRVVCFNHWERLEDLIPLSGEVRALDLLPRIARSRESAKRASSQRRGVCDGLAGTTRVCLPLGCVVVLVCLFAFFSGLNAFLDSLGPGVLGDRGCNDQLLALALCLRLVFLVSLIGLLGTPNISGVTVSIFLTLVGTPRTSIRL